MMDRSFWSDVLRDGALLGLAMALSRTFENYLQLQVDMPIMTSYIILSVEMLIVAGLFVWLLYRFVKRRSLSVDPRMGFNYGQGLIYAFTLSVLTGILVGLANTLFVAVVGYQTYVDSLIATLDRTVEFISGIDQTGAAVESYEKMADTLIETLESSSRPSVFDNILASLNNYITWGTLSGLIIARIVRREPQQLN